MPSRDPRTLRAAVSRQRPLAASLVVVVAAIVLGFVMSVRASALVLAGLLLAIALARLCVPPVRLGALVVRTRMLDVACYGLLGGAVLALALTVPL